MKLTQLVLLQSFVDEFGEDITGKARSSTDERGWKEELGPRRADKV
jgi:hypothetical protein